MPSTILSIATACPPHRMRQSDAAEASKHFSCRTERERRLLSAIFHKSEVASRASVILEPPNGVTIRQSFYPPLGKDEDRGPGTLQRMERYAQEAPILAVQASQQALIKAAMSPEQITHLIAVTCTGFYAPGIDVALIKQLALNPTVERIQVGFMGCHGAINGMRVAHAIACADPDARILLCAVELCSLHFYYGWDVDKVKANALFADGAAALVASGASGLKQPGRRIRATGSCLLPDSEQDMSWRIGDHGFEMTLSPRVPDLIQTHVRPWLIAWLAKQDLTIEQIGSWAVHPGGPRIVSGVATCLELPDSALSTSRTVLAEHGNMSSPTILFILDRLRREQAPLPCVALAFGPGLVAEAALIVD